MKTILNLKLWVATLFLQIEPINHFFTKYIFADSDYLIWLVIVMGLDFLTGVTKAWKNKEAITSKGFRNTVSKCIQYGSFLVLTHILTHFQVGGENPNVKWEWLERIAYEFLLLVEVKSVYENIVAINPSMDIVKGLAEKIGNLIKKK